MVALVKSHHRLKVQVVEMLQGSGSSMVTLKVSQGGSSSAMVDCGPSCAIPSCASAPIVGFAPTGGPSCGFRGLGNNAFARLRSGLGGLGSGFGGFGYGSGSAERAANLGIVDGVIPKPINQTPPAECVIQPPAAIVTRPGAILTASCEPLHVGGYTAFADGGSGIVGGLGYGSGLLGSSGGLGYGRGALLGRKFGRSGSICL